MDVTLVGRGRLGRSLALLWTNAGLRVTTVGRDEPIPPADAVVLCVPDRAIRDMVPRVPAGVVLLHCSGASPVDVLQPYAPAGSLHPLMTFPGPEIGMPDLTGAAAAIDGDPAALSVAAELARAAGLKPIRVFGDRRLYHAAAVLAGNFATTLLADAAAVLERAGVPREECAGILAPLAVASIRNAVPDPAAALTGPIARGDEDTVRAHQIALRSAGLDRILQTYDVLAERTRALAGSK
jgi:predicted short-subunit dehydrogenase-like oxidoreductase (DUF2520 family)